MKSLTICFLLISFGAFASDVQERIKQLHERCYDLIDTDFDSVKYFANQAYELADDHDLNWEKANSLFIIGDTYDSKNELTNALQNYLRASHLIRGEHSEKAINLNTALLINSSRIMQLHHLHDEAIKIIEEVLANTDLTNSPRRELELMFNLASNYHDIENLEESIKILKKMIFKCLSLIHI